MRSEAARSGLGLFDEREVNMECRLHDIVMYYEEVGSGMPLLSLHELPLDHRQVVNDMEPLFRKNYAFAFDVDSLPSPFPAPALFLTGRQDSGCGYREAYELLDNYPRASFAVLDRAGHALGVEQKALFRALANEGLDRVEEYTQSPRNRMP